MMNWMNWFGQLEGIKDGKRKLWNLWENFMNPAVESWWGLHWIHWCSGPCFEGLEGGEATGLMRPSISMIFRIPWSTMVHDRPRSNTWTANFSACWGNVSSTVVCWYYMILLYHDIILFEFLCYVFPWPALLQIPAQLLNFFSMFLSISKSTKIQTHKL